MKISFKQNEESFFLSEQNEKKMRSLRYLENN